MANNISADLEHIHRQLSELGETLARTARPVLVAQEQFLKAMAPALKAVNEFERSVAKSIEPMVRSVDETWRAIEPHIRLLARTLEELPPRQREALSALAEDGWYLDPALSAPLMFSVAADLRQGRVAEAHKVLRTHFRETIGETEARLLARFPARSKVLAAAFRAHREGAYELSVPVFLAQADGVCSELIGEQLYSRKNGYPKLATVLVLEDMPPLIASLLEPLVIPSPISASSKERAGSLEKKLNRHAVLHGEDNEYGTELNGCRALSLLTYVAWAFDKLLNDLRTGDPETGGEP